MIKVAGQSGFQPFAPGRKTLSLSVPFPSWDYGRVAGAERVRATSMREPVSNNSTRSFTCSLLPLKLQPPVTLLFNTLMIMTSALPLALPSCIKYCELFVIVCVCVWAHVSLWQRASDREYKYCVFVGVCVCVFLSPCAVSLWAALLREDGCHRVCCPLARI